LCHAADDSWSMCWQNPWLLPVLSAICLNNCEGCCLANTGLQQLSWGAVPETAVTQLQAQ